MVLTNTNVSGIVATAELMAGLGFVWQFNVSNLGPLGNSFRNYLEVAPRLKDIAPSVRLLRELSARTGLDVRFYRVPLCLLEGRYDLSDNQPRVKIRRAWIGGSIGLLEETHAPEITPRRMISFPATKCGSCELKSLGCPGIFKPYYERYGDEELTPMRAATDATAHG
jgi:hypothetical protein